MKLILGFFYLVGFHLALAQPLTIAHRGDSQLFQENTYPAILSAWKAGSDKVEIEIQTTSDEIIVFHDKKIANQWVNELSLATLRANVGYPVPSLQEILKQKQTISYLFDLKSTESSFIDRLIKQIKESNYPMAYVAFQSNDIKTLIQLKKHL